MVYALLWSSWSLLWFHVSLPAVARSGPLFLFSWVFQVRACRVVFETCFLRVCPIPLLFLCRICCDAGSCPARHHRSFFFFFSDRLMSKMRLRQVMIKVLIVWCMIFVVQLLLHLKSRRDLIFELKIHSLLSKLFLLNVGRFSSVTILRKHACWSGRLGLIPLSSFSVKLYLGLCRVPCPWRACKFTGFSRQPLGHHMLAGVSGSLFLQFLSLASQVMM